MDNSDVTDFTKRLSVAYKQAGGLSAIHKKTGISKSSLSNYKSGVTKPTLDNLIAVADASGVPVGWLANGEGGTTLRADDDIIPPYAKSHKKHLRIAMVENQLSAGSGCWADEESIIDHYTFTEGFIKEHITSSPADKLYLIMASGDSMLPTIRNNDMLMIDTTYTDPTAGGCYAFERNNELFVKRLTRLDKAIRVSSDNPDHGFYTLEGEATNELRVIGRVVWLNRGVG